MRRRGFLATAGALAGLEFDPAALAAAQGTAGAEDPDLAGLVARLPAPDALAAGGDVELAATRPVDGAATLSGPIADAAAVGTVLAGRVGADVAVGVPDTDAVVDRLTAEGYERRSGRRRDGWRVFERRGGRRARVAAVGEDTAILAGGPLIGPVRADVEAVTAALDRHDDGDRPGRTATEADATRRRRRVLDRLGSGVHVAVDLDPGPTGGNARSSKHSGRDEPTPVATGERHAVRGGTTVVRRVALFPSAAAAHDAGTATLGVRPVALERSAEVRRRGRAIVRDAVVPTREAFPDG